MIRAIVIDDEEESRDSIVYILNNYCDNIDIIAEAENVKQGVEAIKNELPDVLFLDIDMPDGTGFDLLEQFPEPDFQVIFITAHDQYALKAIKFSALDYILKPVNPKHLMDAVKKLKTIKPDYDLISKQISTLFKNRNGFDRITLSTFEGLRFVLLNDIIRCEADGNYTNFYLVSGEKILVTKTLKDFDETLSDHDFIRIHKSHLVNLKYIDRYIKGEGGAIVMTDGAQVEVSRRRKEYFLSRLSG